MAFVLSEAQERELAEVLSRYPNKMAACIPVLHLCQNANGNWVKVTQRVPVRVRVLNPDAKFPLRIGTTATVTVDAPE